MHVALFKDSEVSFLAALRESDIGFTVKEPKPGVVMASGSAIDIVQAIATSSAFAAVLVAWLKARASRKIILTLQGNKVLHLEGYSVKQAQEVLAASSALGGH